MQIKKHLYFIVAFFILSANANAQFSFEEPQEYSFRDKIIFGGDFRMVFGTITQIEVAPVIGYKLTPRFTLGAGPRITYFKDSEYGYESMIWGGRVISSLDIIPEINQYFSTPGRIDLFIRAEYELLKIKDYNASPQEPSLNYDALLLGGGIRMGSDGKSGAVISVLWDVINANLIYSNPIIRVGFEF